MNDAILTARDIHSSRELFPMSEQIESEILDSTARGFCRVLLFLIASTVYQFIGKEFFPDPPSGGVNWWRVFASLPILLAAVLIGDAIGGLIDKLRTPLPHSRENQP